MNVRVQIDHATALLRSAGVFYGRCVLRAFSGKVGMVAGWTSGVSLVGLLMAAFASPGASVERLLTTNIPAMFFVVMLGLAVLVALILAPVQLFNEEVLKREAVEALRRPRFHLSLPESGPVNISTRGVTSETMGGDRQTVTTAWTTDVLCFVCENSGETPIHNVRARVMAATKLDEKGAAAPLEITEPIELTWKKDDLKNAFLKDLAPGERCRAWLGGVRSQGQFWIYRDKNDLPIEYQQIFGRAGEYCVLLQLDAAGAPPVQAVLRVRAAEGEKPKTSGIQRGKAEIQLLAQGSPTVQWPMSAPVPAATDFERVGA